MSAKLPIAIVIPHAGLETPPELHGRIALTEKQIFNEADVYTDLLYDFRDRVVQWHVFPYARCILDVNRPRGGEFNNNKMRDGDGFVKHRTSYGVHVYKEGQEPDAALEEHLFDTYWQQWHDTMAQIAADEDIKLVFDCHSMAAVGPKAYDATEQIRPRVAICNLGNALGEPRFDGGKISASPRLTRLAGRKLGEALADIPDLAPVSDSYAVNHPYSGGPIIWLHSGNAQPWLMIELSRATYIGKQTGDSPVISPNKERIELIREKLWDAMVQIVSAL